jgi:hypothetical protein
MTARLLGPCCSLPVTLWRYVGRIGAVLEIDDGSGNGYTLAPTAVVQFGRDAPVIVAMAALEILP